jgi:flagellar hook-length control protein FliK
MLPPVNLLALDSTPFAMDAKTRQGVQPPDNGFRATFGGAMQGVDSALTPSVPFADGGIDACPLPPARGGELPPGGNELPPTGLPGTAEIPAVAIAMPKTPDAPGGAVAEHAETAATQRAVADLAAFAASNAAPAADIRTRDSVARPPAGAYAAGDGAETPQRSPLAAVFEHFRNTQPGAEVRAPQLAMSVTANADGQPGRDAGRTPPATIAPAAAEVAQQAAEQVRAAGGGVPVLPDLLPQSDLQDLRPVPPSALPLPLSTPQASASGTAAPSQWAASQVASQIDRAPGQPGWNEELGDRVLWMAGHKLQNAELRLNPAELGPVRVQISMDDGNATVTFSAQHPLTRDAIEQALPRLREMLADQGLSLQNASVTEHGAKHEQSQAGRQGGAPQLRASDSPPRGATVEAPLTAMATPAGLIDVFA